MKKLLSMILALVMLASVLCLSGCGNSESAGTEGSDTAGAFKLGGIGPTTGPASAYGQAVQWGAEIAVDEINAMEGDIKFEFKFEDDQHDAEKSTNAYSALRDWGMQILVGTVTTAPCLAVAPMTYDDRVFTVTPSASSPDVIEDKDNVFQVCFSDPNQGTASAKYIAQEALGTKVAIIYKSDDIYSMGIRDSFKAQAEATGLEIVSETSFTADTSTDFSVQVLEAKNAGADLLFLPIYYEPAALILGEADKIGYEPLVFGVDGMDGILTVENFDPALAEGVMLLTPFSADSEDEKVQNFVKTYKEKHDGLVPNQFAADAYDAVYAIYEAIKKSGVTSDMEIADMCDKLSAAMTEISLDGLTGAGNALTWNEKGEVSKDPMAVVIKDGVYVKYSAEN